VASGSVREQMPPSQFFISPEPVIRAYCPVHHKPTNSTIHTKPTQSDHFLDVESNFLTVLLLGSDFFPIPTQFFMRPSECRICPSPNAQVGLSPPFFF